MNDFDPGPGWRRATGKDANAPLPAGGTIDPSVLHDVLKEFVEEAISSGFWDLWAMVEAILATVRPGGTIDRDALGARLGKLRSDEIARGTLLTDQEWADVVLALVRPIEGVALTPEETTLLPEILRFWVRVRDEQGVTGPIVDRPRALAERLEKAS